MVVYVTWYFLGVHFPIVVIQSEWITSQALFRAAVSLSSYDHLS